MRILSGSLESEAESPKSGLDIPQISIYSLSPRDKPLTKESISALLDRTQEFSNDQGLVLQYFDGLKIHGEEQLLSALFHALRAEAAGRSRTRDLSVDIARYAAGERQIHLAFEKVGLREGTEKIAALVFMPYEARGQQDGYNRKVLENKLLEFFTEMGMRVEPVLEFEKDGLVGALEKMALIDLKL